MTNQPLTPPTDLLSAAESASSAPRNEVAKRRRTPLDWVLEIGMTIIGVLMLAPLFWMLMQSFTERKSAFQYPPKWYPVDFTWANFAQVFEKMPFGQQFANSVIVMASVTLGSLIFSILAAYAFSRLEFRGHKITFVVMLSALMVPAQLILIPIFVMMRWAGLIDTLWAVILPGLVNVFQIFFLTQYFRSIPRELDEAATLDGAGHLWILFRMLVPLSGPALSALAILSVEASWNAYMGPLILLTSPENMTLPLGLVMLSKGLGAASISTIFAAITMVVVPALIVFLVFQRQFVASIATTGLKG